MEEEQEYVKVPLIRDKDLKRAEEAVELSVYLSEALACVAMLVYRMGLNPESLGAERIWGCTKDMQNGLNVIESLLADYRVGKEEKEGKGLAEQDRD